MMSIIPGFILFGVLIAIHELGHFLACRLTGVKVEKFSIGFGPALFKFRGGETEYSIGILPLGGYVKPAGEQLSEVGGQILKPGDFLLAPVSSRIFIICGGVMMNYFLAFVLFVAFFAMPHQIPANVIGEVQKDSPAAAAGLQTGDRVVKVDGIEVKKFSEIKDKILSSTEAGLQFEIEREGAAKKIEQKSLLVQPRTVKKHDLFGKPITERMAGFIPDSSVVVTEQYGFDEAVTKAAQFEWNYTVLSHKAIFYLITGQMSAKNLSGPVGIVKMSGDAAKQGVAALLFLAAILSTGLAVFNLLPFPALDGGHLIFLLIEMITGKPVSLKFQEKAATFGFVVLMGLMVVVFYNDLVNLSVFSKVKAFFHVERQPGSDW